MRYSHKLFWLILSKYSILLKWLIYDSILQFYKKVYDFISYICDMQNTFVDLQNKILEPYFSGKFDQLPKKDSVFFGQI